MTKEAINDYVELFRNALTACAEALLKGRPTYGHKTGSEIDIVAPGFFHASAKYYRRKGKNCNLGSFFDRKS